MTDTLIVNFKTAAERENKATSNFSFKRINTADTNLILYKRKCTI